MEINFSKKLWTPDNVRTKGLQNVVILDTDYKGQAGQTIIAKVKFRDHEAVYEYFSDGRYDSRVETDIDLKIVIPGPKFEEGELVVNHETGEYLLVGAQDLENPDKLTGYFAVNINDVCAEMKELYDPKDFKKATNKDWEYFRFILGLFQLGWNSYTKNLVQLNHPLQLKKSYKHGLWEIKDKDRNTIKLTNLEYLEIFDGETEK